MKSLSLSLLLLGLAIPLTAPRAETLVARAGDGVADSDDDSGDSGDESSDDDFDLDDILSTGEGEESVEEEVEAVKRGDVDDTVGANAEQVLAEEAPQKRIIKVIEKKNFLKLGRFEATPAAAFVSNDPFLNRYIVDVALGYHLTEIFELEGNFGFSPDLGKADWKPLTKQLVEENKVSPDLSPMQYFGTGSFVFSPIYGKLAVSGSRVINFDIFGVFGMGVVRTADDLEALQVDENDVKANSTAYQLHPTTDFGGGVRVELNQSLAIRLEGRSLVYIETVNATTLEMKNNFILQGGVSFFFPSMD